MSTMTIVGTIIVFVHFKCFIHFNATACSLSSNFIMDSILHLAHYHYIQSPYCDQRLTTATLRRSTQRLKIAIATKANAFVVFFFFFD